jgi:hypothetical protein
MNRMEGAKDVMPMGGRDMNDQVGVSRLYPVVVLCLRLRACSAPGRSHLELLRVSRLSHLECIACDSNMSRVCELDLANL